MNLVFEIDRNRLVDSATGAQVSSLQFAYPDKYPLSIEVTRGNQPFVFSGNVYVTLKPAASPLSAPLALLTVPVNSSSTVTGVLDTYIQEMDDFLPAANKRAAAFEVLVVAPSATTEVSVSVNAQISRRYNSVDQPGVTVAEKSLATQAEAEAGVNNTKWMSPLRVSQAISALANPLDNTDDLSEGAGNLYFTEARAKAAVATDISTAVSAEATARSSADSSLSGGLNDLISALSTESQTRAAGDSSLAGGLASEASTRAAADTALDQRIDFLAENLDPAALDSIAEAAASIGSLQTQIDGKAPTSHTHPISQVTGLSAALDSKQPTGNYVTRDQVQTGGSSYFERSANAASQNVGQGQSVHQIVLANDTRLTDARQPLAHTHPAFTYNSPGFVPNSFGAEAGKFLRGDGTWQTPQSEISNVNGLQTALDSEAQTRATADANLQTQINGKQPTGNYVTRTDVQSGGSSYFERSADAASQNIGQGQSVHQLVLANDTRLSDARRVQWFTAPPNFYTVPNGATAGAMAYDGSFLYLLVPYGPTSLRWARSPMTTTW